MKKWKSFNPRAMTEPILDWILNGIPQKVNVRLFDDVGFIYEAELAKMELSSWWKDLETFRARSTYFEEVNGQKTNHYFISDIRGKGQIGRTCQYLTHWFYPYKAKFHPQMTKALINWMGIKGKERLLDPFVGSGTALIEAKTLGIDSWGVDIRNMSFPRICSSFFSYNPTICLSNISVSKSLISKR